MVEKKVLSPLFYSLCGLISFVHCWALLCKLSWSLLEGLFCCYEIFTGLSITVTVQYGGQWLFNAHYGDLSFSPERRMRQQKSMSDPVNVIDILYSNTGCLLNENIWKTKLIFWLSCHTYIRETKEKAHLESRKGYFNFAHTQWYTIHTLFARKNI